MRHRRRDVRDTILLVGLDPEYTRDLSAILLPEHCDLCFAGIGALQMVVLQQIAPSMIISPLVGDGFDALEIAKFLSDAHYRGHYRIISPKLPRSSVVLSELSLATPHLKIKLLELPDTYF